MSEETKPEQVEVEQEVTSSNVEETAPEADVPVDETDTDLGSDPQEWTFEKSMAEIKKKNSEARNLRERAKKAEAELEQVSDYKAMYEAEVAKNLRMKVAHEFNLPAELAARLQGDSEEELTADAEKLMSLFVPRVSSQRPVPLEGRTSGAPVASEISVDDAAKFFRP